MVTLSVTVCFSASLLTPWLPPAAYQFQLKEVSRKDGAKNHCFDLSQNWSGKLGQVHPALSRMTRGNGDLLVIFPGTFHMEFPSKCNHNFGCADTRVHHWESHCASGSDLEKIAWDHICASHSTPRMMESCLKSSKPKVLVLRVWTWLKQGLT